MEGLTCEVREATLKQWEDLADLSNDKNGENIPANQIKWVVEKVRENSRQINVRLLWKADRSIKIVKYMLTDRVLTRTVAQKVNNDCDVMLVNIELMMDALFQRMEKGT